MAKERGGKIRFIYGIFFALFTVFVGALFIMQTWSIYRSAPQSPYTVESISKHFNEIAIPVWIWVGCLAIGIALAIAFPAGKTRVRAQVDPSAALLRTKKRLPREEELLPKIGEIERKHEGFRKGVTATCTVFVSLVAIFCLATLTDVIYIPMFKSEFFASHDGVVDRISQTAIFSIVALLLVSLAVALCQRSKKKEQKAYLDLIVESKQPKAEVISVPVPVEESETVGIEEKKVSRWEGVIRSIVGALFLGEKKTKREIDEEILAVLQPVDSTPSAPVAKEKPKKVYLPKEVKAKEKKPPSKAKKFGVWTLRVGLCAAGVLCIFIGIDNGGMRDVLMKAINICTQCIGLG